MSRIQITLALVALVAVGSAQEEARTQQPSAQALERMGAIEQEAAAIQAEWQEEQMRLRAEHAAEVERAREEGREPPPRPALSMRPDYSELVQRLFGWADESGGEDAALYLARAVRFDGVAPDTRGRDAFERMLERHPESPSWARLGGLLLQLGRAFDEQQHERILDTLADSPDADVRGWVALARHGQTIEKAALGSEEYRAAKAILLAALEEATDPQLQRELRAPIDLRERLSVNARAPDIEGVDLDGETFKLSEYRGKIILLSFWGDW